MPDVSTFRLYLFELVWKSVWILAFGLPLWTGRRLDPDSQETLKACLMGVVLLPLVMPWRHVLAKYAKVPGDRWGKRAAPGAQRTP